jgi:response regulator RpfG family c-di-GMP phosphodiesterase
MPQLRVKNGQAQGKLYPLTAEVSQLGREAEVQVLDTAASRHHAEVFAIGDMFFIRDLGSRNGTLLNEESLKPEDEALLRVGDLIRIGATQIVFEEPGTQRFEHPEFTSGEEEIGATVELPLDTELHAPAGEPAADVHYSVLFDVAKAVSQAFDVKTMMQKVCDIALGATPADAAYVFIREHGRLVPVAHARRVERGRLKISSTIVRRSLQHSRALLVSDALSDSRFSSSASIAMQGIRSVICAPLLAHSKAAGVLYLHSAALDRAFTDDHLRLVTAISLQAAVAIEAIRAHEESRQRLVSVFRAILTAHERTGARGVEGHSERVYACAQAICSVVDIPPAEAHTIELAALLHKIGTIGAPDGREEARFEFATAGADMLRKIEGLEDVAAAVEAHLERLDGTGGPRHLIGHQIPRAARVVALADEFDSRLSSLGSAPHTSDAIKRVLVGLHEEVETRFDPEAFKGLVVALRSGRLPQA